MKIIVRQCGFTGQLFKTDKEYLKHLKKLRVDQREARRIAEIGRTYLDDNEEIFGLGSIQEVEDWLNANIWRICQHEPNRERAHWSKRKNQWPKRTDESGIKITLNRMTFCEKGTTHSAPRGERTSGWGTPIVKEWAWYGNIAISFTGNGYNHFESGFLKDVGVHTGSGGSRGEGLGYDVTLYAKDFRKMAGNEVYNKLARV